MSNLLSQAFEDAQGSILLYPLETSCPSTALRHSAQSSAAAFHKLSLCKRLTSITSHVT